MVHSRCAVGVSHKCVMGVSDTPVAYLAIYVIDGQPRTPKPWTLTVKPGIPESPKAKLCDQKCLPSCISRRNVLVDLCLYCLHCSLDTSFITLFWSMFGLISLVTLEVNMYYVEVFGKILFGAYNVAAKILLLNMLIAMMSKSFQSIVVSCLPAVYLHANLTSLLVLISASIPCVYTLVKNLKCLEQCRVCLMQTLLYEAHSVFLYLELNLFKMLEYIFIPSKHELL